MNKILKIILSVLVVVFVLVFYGIQFNDTSILFLTRFGYALFPVGAAVGVYYLVRWFKADALEPITKQIVILWTILLLDIGTRVGWFSVSRAFANDTPPSNQNTWMWDNKYMMALVTGAIFITVIFMFINAVEPQRKRSFVLQVCIVILLALLLAMI